MPSNTKNSQLIEFLAFEYMPGPVKSEKYWSQYNEKQYLVTFLIIILVYLLKLVFEQFVEFYQTLNWHLFRFFHSIKYEGGKGINVLNRAWNEPDFLFCNRVFCAQILSMH